MAGRPAAFPDWCMDEDPSKVTQPTQTLMQQGYTQGQSPTPQNFNWMWMRQAEWLHYLDGVAAITNASETLVNSLRMYGGGNWSFNNGTLAWDAPFLIAVPGIYDEQNEIAPASVGLSDGNLAYVELNLPFFTQGDVVSGNQAIANVVETSGIEVGDVVSGNGVPSNTTVQSINGNVVTMTNAATTTASAEQLRFVSQNTLTVQTAFSATFQGDASTLVIARGFPGYAIVGANSGQMILRNTEAKRFLENGFEEIFTATAGQNVLYGQAVYVSDGTDGRTAGQLYLCDASLANGATRANFAGFTQSSVSAGSAVAVIAAGVIAYGSYSPGADYYLDPANVGGITSTKPSGAGSYAVKIGSAYDANHLLIAKAQRPSQSGEVLLLPAGANITAGQVVYISQGVGVDSGLTVGAVYPCDTGATNGPQRAAWIGVALSTIASGGMVMVATRGRAGLYSGLTQGAVYYADPSTPGGITATMPSLISQYVAPVGIALDTATLQINPAGGNDAHAKLYSATQSANLFYAGPLSGSGAPYFRAITAADLPNIAYPPSMFFGDGSDGVANITGSVPLTRDMYYNNLTLSGAGTIQTNGYRIFVAGTLDLSAAGVNAIRANGANGGNGSGSTKGLGAAAPYVVTGTQSLGSGGAGGDGQASGSAGGAGGALVLAMGGAGGNGGGTATGNGYAGGAITAAATLHYLTTEIVGTYNGSRVPIGGGSGGGGGFLSGSTAGSGGGAGGGVIAIYANNLVLGSNATGSVVNVNGGNGGSNSNVQGGGGGGGGFIYVVFKTLTGSTGTAFASASGGAAGGTANAGIAGANGKVAVYNSSTNAVKYVSPTTSIP